MVQQRSRSLQIYWYPYVWGGKDPRGFDCSGFTRYVYLQVTGRDIGGWTVPQESAGTKSQFLKQKLETYYSGFTRRNFNT